MASMMDTGAEERNAYAAESSDPLSQVDILQRVFSFVPKQWLFLVAVSNLWRSVYARSTAGETRSADIHEGYFGFVFHITLYSAAFASPSRVRYSFDCGLKSSTNGYYQLVAGRYGTAASLAAARELGMRPSPATLLGAVEGNQLAVVQLLNAQGCSYSWSVAEAAAKRGDMQILRWLRERGCAWNNVTILRCAVASGSVEMTAWVKQQPGVVCDEHTMTAAAKMGYTAVCECLHADLCTWNADACDAATRNNHADTLRWLHEHGCPWCADRVR
jgi:hypothetical protein